MHAKIQNISEPDKQCANKNTLSFIVVCISLLSAIYLTTENKEDNAFHRVSYMPLVLLKSLKRKNFV